MFEERVPRLESAWHGLAFGVEDKDIGLVQISLRIQNRLYYLGLTDGKFCASSLDMMSHLISRVSRVRSGKDTASGYDSECKNRIVELLVGQH